MKKLFTDFRSFFCLDAKFLVLNLITRNLKIRYRRSFLGYLWTMLIPLALASIYYFTFKVVLKVKAENFGTMVITGLLLWNFFSTTMTEGMESLISNFLLLRQVKVPLNVFPYSSALANFFTLVLSLPIILLFFLISGLPMTWVDIFFFYYLIILFCLVYFFSFLLSLAVVYVRDLKQGLSILIQLWFYGTPIVYTADMVPEKYQWVLYVNPLGFLYSGVQECLFKHNIPTPEQLFIPLGWMAGFFLISFFSFCKINRIVVEKI